MDPTSQDTSNCPYSNLMSKFNIFGKGENNNNSIPELNSTIDTEKGIELTTDKTISKCPYNHKAMTENQPEVSEKPSKCPVNHKEVKEKETKENEKLSDEEEEAQGGCPVMNKTKKDPVNKHFEAHYEIPRFGPFDFMFLMRGALDQEEWLEKSQKIRKFPRHMKYTLFVQHQEKLQKVHEKEFPVVFFMYDDIKEKGNRLFRRKKYREAIEHYVYAYGLLKWIQFKDKKRQEEFLKKPSLDAILDEDIEEKHVYLDDVQVEEDSFKACVVYLLMNMAYAYMELRHYSEAVDCLDECLTIAEDKVPDLFFRRSQARTYNKFSSDEELELAMQDIEKAMKLKDDPIYKEHKDILEKIMNERLKNQIEKTEKVLTKAKRSYQKIKERNINVDEVIYTKKDKDANTQYKILKEMRNKYSLAIKFFTESKNEEQLELCYKEIEAFMNTFDEFKFFLRFSVSEIPMRVVDNLSEEEKQMLEDDTMLKLIDEFKYKLCEDVFGEGNFNFELFQYALEKIFEEERKQQEEEERRLEESRPKVSWLESIKKSSFVKYLSGGLIVLSVGSIGVHYYLYSSSSGIGSFFK